MRTSLFFFLLTIIGLASIVACSEGQVFKHYENVKHFKWSKSDAKTYAVEIKEAGVAHQVELALRHITETPLSSLSVQYKITAPDGTEKNGTTEIALRDKDGKLLGEVAYQFTDISVVAESDWTPSAKGTYTFTLTHNYEEEVVPTIMEVGLLVSRKE